MTEQQTKSNAARVLDAAIVVFIFLFAVSAPISIAAAQTSWLIGMVLWLARFAFYPRPAFYKTPVDYPLLGFFILTGLSAFLSYEPLVSIGKLRAASLFTIVYLIAENVTSFRIIRLLAISLIGACLVTVLYTAGERIVGRGVKVYGVSEQSLLHKAGIRDGDTLLSVDAQKLRDPQELVNALSKPDKQPAQVVFYRIEWQPTIKIPRANLFPGATALEQLGIAGWSHGRDWRASGFFGHYVTYAEVLQLVIALTLGIFVAMPTKKSWPGLVLVVALAGLGFAFLLTVTRAPWLGSLVSSAIILLFGARRRTLVFIGVLAIPLILAGLFVLQQKRNIAFVDKRDDSTTWRTIVWREGFHLLVSNPRHLLVGIGMDSIKGHWREWGMFDHGRIPTGHMHSNLLQLALERGLPTLMLWLLFLFVYARTLWRSLRILGKLKLGEKAEGAVPGDRNISELWMERGILLGALGGLAGFFLSGLVHYNWGDSEVVMVLYFIMGLALAIHGEAVRRTHLIQVRS